MKHEFKKGDIVWWTMGGQLPLPFSKEERFVGIVVNISERAEGVEVYWFNNNIFKTINFDHLMKVSVEMPTKKI
tara:strand:- start:71 stop:292 length:222 start_codon:yes stop_codon:yes gene_type:complete